MEHMSIRMTACQKVETHSQKLINLKIFLKSIFIKFISLKRRWNWKINKIVLDFINLLIFWGGGGRPLEIWKSVVDL